jgi:hypothetical protein
MTNSDQAHQLLMEAMVIFATIARSTGVLDIDQTIAQNQIGDAQTGIRRDSTRQKAHS